MTEQKLYPQCKEHKSKLCVLCHLKPKGKKDVRKNNKEKN